MLKGHTKIELTDVNTGEVEVVEDDNLITNLVAQFFKWSPVIRSRIFTKWYPYSHFPNSSTRNPFALAETFFGGLLLLDKTLEENPDAVTISDDITMIGNAASRVQSSATKEIGSFNMDESVFTDESGLVTIKFVYDFATSQANGKISCVCLCSHTLGLQGLGNIDDARPVNFSYTGLNANYNLCEGELSDWFYDRGLFDVFADVCYIGFPKADEIKINNSSYTTYYTPIMLDASKNVIYCVHNSQFNVVSNSGYFDSDFSDLPIANRKSLLLTVFSLPITEFSPLSYSDGTSVSDSRSYTKHSIMLSNKLSEIEIELPEEFTNYLTDERHSRMVQHLSDKNGIYLIIAIHKSMDVMPDVSSINVNSRYTLNTAVLGSYYSLKVCHIHTDLKQTEIFDVPLPDNTVFQLMNEFSSCRILNGYLYFLSGTYGSTSRTTGRSCDITGNSYLYGSDNKSVDLSTDNSTIFENRGLYKIELANPTNVVKIPLNMMDKYTTVNVIDHFHLYVNENRIFVGIYYTSSDPSVSYPTYILVNDKLYPINGSIAGPISLYYLYNRTINNDYYGYGKRLFFTLEDISNTEPNIVVNCFANSGNFLEYNPVSGTQSSAITSCYFLQVYPRLNGVSTINNLPSPVVKTADKTMKVTYTLTSDMSYNADDE